MTGTTFASHLVTTRPVTVRMASLNTEVSHNAVLALLCVGLCVCACLRKGVHVFVVVH